MVRSSASPIRTLLRRFLADQRGATSLEYAIIASGISIVIVGTVASIGSTVENMFSTVASALK
ncbi:MAG TPA: Flp family type IVb pilin [Xanthobacteraceae bacterium]|nr:Flp family type IVb pilin [Xanthobacteraceae bacterium]